MQGHASSSAACFWDCWLTRRLLRVTATGSHQLHAAIKTAKQYCWGCSIGLEGSPSANHKLKGLYLGCRLLQRFAHL